MHSILNCNNVAKYIGIILDSYGSMWLSLVMQGVSKTTSQWYSK
jgi:hypothetical protein